MAKPLLTRTALAAIAIALLTGSNANAQTFDGEWRGTGSCSGGGPTRVITLSVQSNAISGVSRILGGKNYGDVLFHGRIDPSNGALSLKAASSPNSQLQGRADARKISVEGWTGEGTCNYSLERIGVPSLAVAPANPASGSAPALQSPPSPPSPGPNVESRQPQIAQLHPQPVPSRDAFLSQTAQEMKVIQRSLAALGHYRGELDGVYGPGTAAAIDTWKRSQGLPTAGYLTLAEMDRVKSQALSQLGGATVAPTPSQAAPSKPSLSNTEPVSREFVRQVDVPVVVCPVDGQVGSQTLSKEPRSIRTAIPEELASRLVYYRALQGHPNVHVLGPRGWRCLGLYGSNGDTALIVPPNANPAQKERLHGPAIEVRFRHGGTSGRTAVADTAGPIFPVAGRFIDEVEANFRPTEKYRRTPWPTEQITRISERLLTFLDPPSVSGTGSQGRLAASTSPIQGVAAFTEESNLWALAIRLDEVDAALGPTILADFQTLAARMIKPSPAISPISESAARPAVSGTPLTDLSQLTGLWVPITAFPQGCAPSPHWIARSGEAMKIEPKRIWGYEWSCDVLNASGMADGSLRASGQCGHVEKEAATLTLSLALGRLTYKAQYRSGQDQTGIYQKCQR